MESKNVEFLITLGKRQNSSQSYSRTLKTAVHTKLRGTKLRVCSIT
jgi:hypothetical protein